ncbi:MAG: CPBP family intramembrane metalloprotease [Victivallales bacterium]|nr:CPBP family intramembrane metalloprotease [Victivallales bacterium]MCF7889388.1 CPBP family intramembrane metalloprotease [Victivallales bacterium]
MNNYTYTSFNEEEWLNRVFPIAVLSIFCSVLGSNTVFYFLQCLNYPVNSFVRIILATVFVQFGLLVPLLLFFRFFDSGSIVQIFKEKLKFIKFSRQYFFTAVKIEFIIFIPLCFSALLIHKMLVYFGLNPVSPLMKLMENADIRGVIVVALISVFIAPLGEEIIFRRIFYSFSNKMMSRVPAVLTTSFLFAILHGGIVQIIPLTVFGCILQFLYIKYESLYPCIILHSFHNFVLMTIFIALFLK